MHITLVEMRTGRSGWRFATGGWKPEDLHAARDAPAMRCHRRWSTWSKGPLVEVELLACSAVAAPPLTAEREAVRWEREKIRGGAHRGCVPEKKEGETETLDLFMLLAVHAPPLSRQL